MTARDLNDFAAPPAEYLRRMTDNDHYTRWLGLEILKIDKGYCKLRYVLREDMQNGFGMAHGGILFGASDSAFAFASNSYGNLSVALDVTISYLKPGKTGDVLTVEATEEHRGRKTALYRITTRNQDDEKICVFTGTVYRTGKEILETQAKQP